MSGEFDFISWLKDQSRSASSMVKIGIGDDLAALKFSPDELILVGTDQVLDGVHFDSAVHSPIDIGRKVMNRNLSDCAAMGCLPAAALATVALPNGVGINYARDLYRGLRAAADLFSCAIVGGDTGTWPGKLVLSVTIIGRSEGIAPVTRAGAKPGETICVTGALGGSILGRHLSFTPRVSLGRLLARGASAMIDLSDGLSRDMTHICAASGVGAIIDANHIPIHPDAISLFQRDNISPLQHALSDGEDYELLFTSSLSGGQLPADSIPIGKTTSSPGIFLRNADGSIEPLEPRGWEHPL